MTSTSSFCRLFVATTAFAWNIGFAPAQSVQIQVDVYRGATKDSSLSGAHTPGETIALTVDEEVTRICLYTTPETGTLANVGPVVISNSNEPRSSDLEVILQNRPGNLAFPGVLTELPAVGANWAGIAFDQGTQQWSKLSGAISGDLTGQVSAQHIVRLQIGGSVQQSITATGNGDAVEFLRFATSTSDGVTCEDTRLYGTCVVTSRSDCSCFVRAQSMPPGI